MWMSFEQALPLLTTGRDVEKASHEQMKMCRETAGLRCGLCGHPRVIMQSCHHIAFGCGGFGDGKLCLSPKKKRNRRKKRFVSSVARWIWDFVCVCFGNVLELFDEQRAKRMLTNYQVPRDFVGLRRLY
jgi:hypothetical protein